MDPMDVSGQIVLSSIAESKAAWAGEKTAIYSGVLQAIASAQRERERSPVSSFSQRWQSTCHSQSMRIKRKIQKEKEPGFPMPNQPDWLMRSAHSETCCVRSKAVSIEAA